MSPLLTKISELSTPAIIVCAVVHLGAFIYLWMWYRSDLSRMAATLDDFTRGLQHRSVLDRTSHLSDQIEAFLADVNEVLARPSQGPDRQTLLQRVKVLDEKRRYLESMRFEISYNVCRTMIEAYPLGGILGTILAIGAALQAGSDASVGLIVQRFGEAIWSTCAGLIGALAFMFFNSLIEPPFLRLTENREHVRHMVAKVKGALLADSGGPA